MCIFKCAYFLYRESLSDHQIQNALIKMPIYKAPNMYTNSCFSFPCNGI